MNKKVMLVVIDGLGLRSEIKGNAWKMASTPCLDDLMNNYPHVALKASGPAVGLPEGQMGNSEVGHLNLGAGQIVYTGLELISKSLQDGSFNQNKALLKSISHAQKQGSNLHVMGLLSPGGVHSNEAHLYAIIDMVAKSAPNLKTFIHVFGDGRDVAPQSIIDSLNRLNKEIAKHKNFTIASIQGRVFAMDRDQQFEKTEVAFSAICGASERSFTDVVAYVESEYSAKVTDEFLRPAINKDLPQSSFLKSNDAVIFFNFRPDRARQLAHLIIGSSLYQYTSKRRLTNVQLTSMMRYEGIDAADVAFDSMEIAKVLGEVVAEAGLTQLRCAETQKYAHVTFFFDGGKDEVLKGQKRLLVDSLKIENFATAPAMSAVGITDTLLKNMASFDFIVVNYANPDMVGHTGDLNGAIKAVEIVDQELMRLKKAADELGITMFITADHGNAEIMIDEKGGPNTKHTTSDVPFICTDRSVKLVAQSKSLSLVNVAPTVIDYLGLKKPANMDHESLIFPTANSVGQRKLN